LCNHFHGDSSDRLSAATINNPATRQLTRKTKTFFMKSIRTSWAIFAAAALLSAVPALRAQTTNTPPAGGRQGRGGNVDQQLTRLSEQLNLTADQKPKVKAVLEDQNKKMA